MSNFDFLKTEWRHIYRDAKEAEKLCKTSPKASCILSRSTLELGVNWMYEHDQNLRWPYDRGLSKLIHDYTFREIIGNNIFKEVDLIRRIGNNAAHGKRVQRSDAMQCLKYLFRFTSFLSKIYSEENPILPPFDESLLPTGEERKEQREEIELLNKKISLQHDKLAAKLEELERERAANEALQAKLKEKEALLATRVEERRTGFDVSRDIPQLVSEAETRRKYIDVLLKDADWDDLREGFNLEYEVSGMPVSTNPSGKGFADYVLWGQDGKPLAVIEAKKASADAANGKYQAKLYADCLEQMHGQRPIIFYTNGFETYIWDDQFSTPRQVAGFFTKDQLQLMIDRRFSRKDLRTFDVNKDIAGRAYQLEAIQRVAETLTTGVGDGKIKGRDRKALLIMATGTGKTRTSAAIVDMMTKCNWAKRILFLADRNALVKQAKNAFNEHLPNLTAIDLTKEKENNTTRLVFSTYQTMMNKIDNTRTDSGLFYGVGHFDLIIIDEAHRSVYQKFGAIFKYFDSLLIGLTATPKDEIDRNTYSLFDMEDKNPTFSYDLDKAVDEGYLVKYQTMKVESKFIREGVVYDELSKEEQEEYEEKLADDDGNLPGEVNAGALNSWLFNADTVDQILYNLMKDGIKVEGGDKLGKTIIFAKNHKHAIFIEERFNKNYPQYSGSFLEVIDNYNSKAQDLLEQFVYDKEEKEPQIAVSVDMMDTGVDAPRVVNLVFFKAVYSKSKFWQMVGRGTRLRPDLFGPGMHKEHFLIFDCCGNFEFFRENEEGRTATVGKSLTQRNFELKLDIIVAVRDSQEASEEAEAIQAQYTDELLKMVKNLDRERFEVRMAMEHVEKYSNKEAWAMLNDGSIVDLKTHISGLIPSNRGDHEKARRFDILMLNLQLAELTQQNAGPKISEVASIARNLSKVRIDQVSQQKETLDKVQKEQFWESATVKDHEGVRVAMRELMQFLESSQIQNIYTNFKDDVKVEEGDSEYKPTNLKPYKERVESFLRENKTHISIKKIINNEQITDLELGELERLLFENEELGSREDFVKEYGEKPLIYFIRSILGLDVQAARAAFSEFLQGGNLRADQMTFIDNIITAFTKEGVVEPSMLFQSPFTDINDMGLMGVFDEAGAHKVISIIREMNENAGVSA